MTCLVTEEGCLPLKMALVMLTTFPGEMWLAWLMPLGVESRGADCTQHWAAYSGWSCLSRWGWIRWSQRSSIFSLFVILWKLALILEAENGFNMVSEAFISFISSLWAVVFLSDETVLSLHCFLVLLRFKKFCFSLLLLFLFVIFTSCSSLFLRSFSSLSHFVAQTFRKERVLTLVLNSTARWG